MLRRNLVVVMATAVVCAAGCSPGDSPTAATSSSGTTAGSAAAPSASVTSGSTAAAQTTEAGSAPVTPAVAAGFEPSPIEWEPFSDAVEVGTLEVPVDYDDPDGPRFELFLARYKALDPEQRIGTLLVNPGGPGYGGTDLVFGAAQTYDRPLLERFDIVGWDPRGTGESDPPIDCVDDFDPYFGNDSTPETEDERMAYVEAAQQFAAACEATSGDILQHVGTNDSARDIDAIRRALGEEQLSFFGFSYGSELGGVWATMFPDTVRALVVDGAVDPDADPQASAVQQITGFEASLGVFLAQCSDDEGCAFNNRGDAEGAYDALMASLDAAPIPGGEGRLLVNRDVATVATLWAMYSEDFWPALAQSLAAAQAGDGSGLLALYDAYYERAPDGTWGNQIEAFRIINCIDRDDRRTVEEIDAQMAAMHEAAPRLVPDGALGTYVCTFLPPSTQPRIDITGAGEVPVVVIGTTGDPSTPLESTRRMAEAFGDGRLVIVQANRHTGYGVNRCVIDIVNRYLIDLEPPAEETTCD